MTTRTDRIATKGLVPRDQIFYDERRSTRGKIDAYTVLSQSSDDGSYHCTHTHHNDADHCDCPGFQARGYCKHVDSYRFYAAQRAFARVIRTETDDYIASRDNALAVRELAHGLDWEERAEWAAISDEVLRRIVADERGVA